MPASTHPHLGHCFENILLPAPSNATPKRGSTFMRNVFTFSWSTVEKIIGGNQKERPPIVIQYNLFSIVLSDDCQ